jgi:hypothetical protein
VQSRILRWRWHRAWFKKHPQCWNPRSKGKQFVARTTVGVGWNK